MTIMSIVQNLLNMDCAFFCNHMTISDYSTKTIYGEFAFILKLHRFTRNCMGSLEIARGQLLNM